MTDNLTAKMRRRGYIPTHDVTAQRLARIVVCRKLIELSNYIDEANIFG